MLPALPLLAGAASPTDLSLLLLISLIGVLGITTFGVWMVLYLSPGAVSWPLVAVTGVPEMVGVWLGWKIAHAVPARPLTYLLATDLLALGPVLLLRA